MSTTTRALPEALRHQAIVIPHDVWFSWVTGTWLTDGCMMVRTATQWRTPASLDLGCGCDDVDAENYATHDLHDCPNVQSERDIHDDRLAALPKAISNILPGADDHHDSVRLVPATEPCGSLDAALVYRAILADGTWLALQRRYCALIEQEASPDRWTVYRRPYQAGDPHLIAAWRGDVCVGVIRPLLADGSLAALGLEGPS